jgi:hypothetical protein
MLAVAILALTGLVLPGCADAPAAVEPALLGAGELGPDWTAGVVNPDEPRWPWVQEDCPTYRDADFPAQRHRQDAVARQYLRASSRAAALQVVEAYESGWASRALDDVRRVLRTCGTYSAYGGQISFNLLDSDFAGDAALLIRGRISSPDVPATASYFVVVRRGDIVSTLNLPDSGGEDQARVVATRLASQLGQR